MSLALSIITPERLVSQKTVDFVVVPAASGEIGVYEHHAPLLAQLVAGEVRLSTGAHVERLAVSGGFVEVSGHAISIFAETAEMAQEIDVERARQAVERARAFLRSSQPDVDMERAEAALRRAVARLHVAEFSRRKTARP